MSGSPLVWPAGIGVEPGRDLLLLAAEALGIMEAHAITSLFIVDPATRRPRGIVHLHDLLKAGVA